jgi:glycerol-3-phosphate dehydrogenase subunit B
VFEIPALPPSAAGIRVYEALRSALGAAGGRLVIGPEVREVQREGERITAVTAHTSGHASTYRCGWVVLATGGFHSGAITLSSDWHASETVLGLPLQDMPAADEPRFAADYFGPQPMSTAGVAVDGSLRAHGAENVFVAGAALPGAVSWREGSGEGIAISSGSVVAQAVIAQAGAVTSA